MPECRRPVEDRHLIHEAVVGPTGSGKTFLARALMAEEDAAGFEVWIVDPTGVSLPQWRERATRYAASIAEARELFAEASERDPSQAPVTITVEAATWVLSDPTCRLRVEDLVQASPGNGVRLRMVAQTLHLTGFGGSTVIGGAIRAGMVWLCAGPGNKRQPSMTGSSIEHPS